MKPCAECGGLPSSPFTGLCAPCARAYADGTAYFGALLDDIAARLDEAYANRRPHPYASPAYAEADVALELVFDDLRRLNLELLAREAGVRPDDAARLLAQDPPP